MRSSLAVLALTALAAGCGSSTSGSERGTPRTGSLEALWKASGESVGLIPGSSDYSPGELRISFLVVDGTGRVIARPRARVWIARSRSARPYEVTVARLEHVGLPGRASGADVKAIYVAHVRAPAPGTYYVLARPIGGSMRIGGMRELLVKRHSATPAIGARAYPSDTPTLASTGGRIAQLTTRVPPDRALLRHSVADLLAGRVPFVLTFSTPRWCSSRTCGPVVDVVDFVRRRFARSGIRFVHVEIYKGNDPRNGANRWVREWHLPGEPWTFLVGSDGRIKAKFDGTVSVRELTQAVDRYLR